MLKVMTIVGTRPEIIRLSRVIDVLDKHCQHTLVHTGQNFDYQLNGVFFEELRIRKPDIFLDAAGETAAETIGRVIIASDKAMQDHAPDAVLILGDTNSALAAISAKRRMIPIFHMEAGNRCFDFRVPEEINRRIVDHVSDVNLTYSDIAREYLIREGLPADRIIKTGSPMREVLNHYRPDIDSSDVLSRLGLAERGYFLVSSHRQENVDRPDQLAKLFATLDAIISRYGQPVIVSTHPRTRKRILEMNLAVNPGISFMEPFGFLDYIKLQMNARAVLSDSGTITEESSILNFPALNIREAHERPEGFLEAAVMMVGLDRDRVMQALDILETQPRGENRLLHLVDDYAPDNVSHKVLRILVSYTDYVNRTVWKK
jgi:UDP-N-acetylglucosamine 2-epimerase